MSDLMVLGSSRISVMSHCLSKSDAEYTKIATKNMNPRAHLQNANFLVNLALSQLGKLHQLKKMQVNALEKGEP